jgi:hypothetical protein
MGCRAHFLSFTAVGIIAENRPDLKGAGVLAANCAAGLRDRGERAPVQIGSE